MDAACQVSFAVSTVSTQTATANYRDQASQTYIYDSAFRNGLISSNRESVVHGRNIQYFNSLMNLKQRRNSSAEILHRYHEAATETTNNAYSSSDSVFGDETGEPSQKFTEYPKEPLDLASTIILSEEIDTTQVFLNSKPQVNIEKSDRLSTVSQDIEHSDVFSTDHSLNIGETPGFKNKITNKEDSSKLFSGDDSLLFSEDDTDDCQLSPTNIRNDNDSEVSAVSYTAKDFENISDSTVTCETNYNKTKDDNSVASIKMNNFATENWNLPTSSGTKDFEVEDAKEHVNRDRILESYKSLLNKNDESLFSINMQTKISIDHEMDHKKTNIENANDSNSAVSPTVRVYENASDSTACVTNCNETEDEDNNSTVSQVIEFSNEFSTDDSPNIGETSGFKNTIANEEDGSKLFLGDDSSLFLEDDTDECQLYFSNIRNANDNESEVSAVSCTARGVENISDTTVTCETNNFEVKNDNSVMSSNINIFGTEDRNLPTSLKIKDFEVEDANEQFNRDRVLESYNSLPNKNDESLFSINMQTKMSNDHEMDHKKTNIENANDSNTAVSRTVREYENAGDSTVACETNFNKSEDDDTTVSQVMKLSNVFSIDDSLNIGEPSIFKNTIANTEDCFKLFLEDASSQSLEDDTDECQLSTSYIRNANDNESEISAVSYTARVFENVSDASVTCETNSFEDDNSVMSINVNNFGTEDRNLSMSSETKDFGVENANEHVNRDRMLESHNSLPNRNDESLLNINMQTKMSNDHEMEHKKSNIGNANDSDCEVSAVSATVRKFENAGDSTVDCKTDYNETKDDDSIVSIKMNNFEMGDRNFSTLSETKDFGMADGKERVNRHKSLAIHNTLQNKNSKYVFNINLQTKIPRNDEHLMNLMKLIIRYANDNKCEVSVVSSAARDFENDVPIVTCGTNYFRVRGGNYAVFFNTNNFGIEGGNTAATFETKFVGIEDGVIEDKLVTSHSLLQSENCESLLNINVQIKLPNNRSYGMESPNYDKYFMFIPTNKDEYSSIINSIIFTQGSLKHVSQRMTRVVPSSTQKTLKQYCNKQLKINPIINTIPCQISFNLDTLISLQSFRMSTFSVEKEQNEASVDEIISSNMKINFSIKDEFDNYCASTYKDFSEQREVEILSSHQTPQVNLKIGEKEEAVTNKVHDSIVEQKTDSLEIVKSNQTSESHESVANNPFKFLSVANHVQKMPHNLDHVTCSFNFSLNCTDTESEFEDFLSKDYSIGNIIASLRESVLPEPKFSSTHSNSAIVERKSDIGGILTNESSSFDNSESEDLFIEEDLPKPKSFPNDRSHSKLDCVAEASYEHSGRKKSLEKRKKRIQKIPQIKKKQKTTSFESTGLQENESQCDKPVDNNVSNNQLENKKMKTSNVASDTSCENLINQEPSFDKKCEENEKNYNTKIIKLKEFSSQSMPVRCSPRLLKLKSRSNSGKELGSDESSNLLETESLTSNSAQSTSMPFKILKSSTRGDNEKKLVHKSVTLRKLPTTLLESISSIFSTPSAKQTEKKSSKSKTECSQDPKSKEPHSITLNSRKDRSKKIPDYDKSCIVENSATHQIEEQIKPYKLTGARPKILNPTRKKTKFEKKNHEPISDKEENIVNTSRTRTQNPTQTKTEGNRNLRKQKETSFPYEKQLNNPETTGLNYKSRVRKLNPSHIDQTTLKTITEEKLKDSEQEMSRLRTRHAKRTIDSKEIGAAEKRVVTAAKNSRTMKKNVNKNSEAETRMNVDVVKDISSKTIPAAQEKAKIGLTLSYALNETRIIVPIVKKTRAAIKANKAEGNCVNTINNDSEDAKKQELKKTLRKRKI